MKKTIFTALILLTLISPLLHAQEYTLRYKLKKGTEYNYTTSVDVSQSMSQGGGDVTFGGLISNVMKTAVTNVSKKGNELTLNFSKAVMTTRGLAAMTGMNDTTMPVGLIDQISMKLTTGSRGHILTEERTTLDTNDIAVQQFATSLNELTKTFFLVYPEKALKKGESWAVSVSDTSVRDGGSIITSSTMDYTFDGIVDTLGVKCARITAKSSSLTISGNMEMAQGMKMTMDGDGINKSTSYVELSTGMPVVNILTSEIDTRMMLSGQQNMIMPAQTDMKVVIRRIKE